MKPGDRLVCAFVIPQPLGTQFQTWLLHVTIVPWFRLSDESARLAKGLRTALTPLTPFRVRVNGEAQFGPRHNRPAHLLEAGLFPLIERRVRNYLHKKRAWLVDETTKRKQPFRPHVTFQERNHLRTGDSVYCDRLYIVEQHGTYKEIVAEIPFE